jgi:hypothetical protein
MITNFRREAREGTHKLYAPDGSISAAYDDTSRPIYDTRVWLHMYDSPSGLKPSFCKRTGAAQYMYDFTGFSEWRVEQNALLSDEAKCLMYKLWKQDHSLWSDVTLARLFKIRVQRALAIVKVKEAEFNAVCETSPLSLVKPNALFQRRLTRLLCNRLTGVRPDRFLVRTEKSALFSFNYGPRIDLLLYYYKLVMGLKAFYKDPT